MRWLALLFGLSLAVALYVIADQNEKYVEMRNYAVKMIVKSKINEAAYAKCVRDSWKST